jgi:hypothetical protein
MHFYRCAFSPNVLEEIYKAMDRQGGTPEYRPDSLQKEAR